MERLCSELDDTKISRARDQVILREIGEKRKDILVECGNVICSQPGENGLTDAVGALVKRATQKLAFA